MLNVSNLAVCLGSNSDSRSSAISGQSLMQFNSARSGHRGATKMYTSQNSDCRVLSIYLNAVLIRTASLAGGSPNARAYSRLNWVELS